MAKAITAAVAEAAVVAEAAADMDPAKASVTAAGVAVARGAHRSYDQPPWVLDDPFALQLVGSQWAAVQAASEAALPAVALRQSRASVVARSRYAEDQRRGPLVQPGQFSACATSNQRRSSRLRLASWRANEQI
jgi:hypothetical protein